MDNLTQERLKEVLVYNPKTGVWIYRKRDLSRGRPSLMGGKVAGHVDKKRGYRKIWVDKTLFYSSRLAYFYIQGYFPENDIDHINRNKSDDRWCNLREVSRSCNMRNTGNRATNTSGVKGVGFDKKNNKWVSHITVYGKVKRVYRTNDFNEAVLYRLAAEQCLDWASCDSSSPAYQYAVKNGLVKKP